MKSLIHMRKSEEACRSLHFHFPNAYENRRCIEYIKLDSKGGKMEVLVNCSDEDVQTGAGGEILFERNFEEGVLKPKGTLIRKIWRSGRYHGLCQTRNNNREK